LVYRSYPSGTQRQWDLGDAEIPLPPDQRLIKTKLNFTLFIVL
jgi:hypothetical protein